MTPYSNNSGNSNNSAMGSAPPAKSLDFFSICRELNAEVDRQLNQFVPTETVKPSSVHRAMRWSLFAGGKRLRPLLTLLTGRAFGSSDEKLLSTACAFEMVHAYSLIHDDLPSMDNDDLRRGHPTCHVQFGEATAILAGDALQTLAFQAIAADENLDAPLRLRLIIELAQAAGTPHGMVAGQAFDLEAETGAVINMQPENIHRLKTGAMIIAATRCGAIIGGAGGSELERVTSYGAHLGLLFQITDDLLDVTATASEIGKTPGKDARARKITYPEVYGMDESLRLAKEAHAKATAELRRLHYVNPAPIENLIQLADYVLNRRS